MKAINQKKSKPDPIVEAGLACVRVMDNPKSTDIEKAQAKQVFLLTIKGYVDSAIAEALGDKLTELGLGRGF